MRRHTRTTRRIFTQNNDRAIKYFNLMSHYFIEKVHSLLIFAKAEGYHSSSAQELFDAQRNTQYAL